MFSRNNAALTHILLVDHYRSDNPKDPSDQTQYPWLWFSSFQFIFPARAIPLALEDTSEKSLPSCCHKISNLSLIQLLPKLNHDVYKTVVLRFYKTLAHCSIVFNLLHDIFFLFFVFECTAFLILMLQFHC